MPPHNTPGVVIPLHRMVALPIKTLDQVVRESAVEAHPDLIDQLREHGFREPTLLERVGDFFGSDRGFCFQLGFASGAFFCCGALILWTVVLA